jgi:hypothetical protein
MPTALSDGNPEKHMLTLSSSQFDPTATSPGDAPGKINALLSATMIEM